MIADTGAICDSAAWNKGVINMKISGDCDKIKSANG